jgi:hypothetical protein
MATIGFSVQQDNSYGFVGGMSAFNYSIKHSSGLVDESESTGLGLYVGVFGERYLSSSWVFSPGIYLSQKGGKTASSTGHASYLETSALLRYYFFDKPRWRSYLGFGGAFGVLLSAEDMTNSGLATDQFSSFNKNELSAQLGLGFEFPFADETGMQVGLTYSRGLTSYLDPTKVSGDKGTWNGFYAFVALRLKPEKGESSAQDRAYDYLRSKKGEL